MGKNRSVLVVGDVMLDRYFFGSAERISPEAPVPVVRIHRIDERPGGAANVAMNIVSLGCNCMVLSPVGRDEVSTRLTQLLHEQHIETYFCADAGIQTTLKLRVVAQNQQMIRLDFEQSPTPNWISFRDEVFLDLVKRNRVVIFSDYAKGALSGCQSLINTASEYGKMVLVDPKGKDFSEYRGANLITPNAREFGLAEGIWQDEHELESLASDCRQRLKFDSILITRGKEGMTLFDDLGRLHVNSDAREVFDVSGAGDTVVATIAVMMAEGKSLRESIVIANRAAGLVVGKLGTARVTRDELLA